VRQQVRAPRESAQMSFADMRPCSVIALSQMMPLLQSLLCALQCLGLVFFGFVIQAHAVIPWDNPAGNHV
jgi:hypothetical protein